MHCCLTGGPALLPAFINDDKVSGYGYPFEVIHSSILPTSEGPSSNGNYWLIGKGGAVPGHSAMIQMNPLTKLGVVAQSNSISAMTTAMTMMSTLLSPFDDILWAIHPLPPDPGNLTDFAGVYIAKPLFGIISVNVTVVSMMKEHMLRLLVRVGSADEMTTEAIWVEGNTFQTWMTGKMPCLWLEGGFDGASVTFYGSWWSSRPQSLILSGVDPFYGWTFYRQ